MSTAKRDGTGVQVYRADGDQHSARRLALAGSLRSAIERGELVLHFQPQTRLTGDRLHGVEALVRWEHPEFGLVPPDEFIDIAEQTGQIRELTRWVLDRACATWAALVEQGHRLDMSVNVSVRNLLEPDLTDAVARILAQHGMPGRRLTLELTESHLMADTERTENVLRELAGLGVRLSIDDFGTGYSSLAYLRHMPVAEVKIDRSFVAGVTVDANQSAIVEAIIQLAHTLQLEVVAEGIEDEAAQRHLAGLGCDLVQGYHLGRPMPLAQLTTWLAGRRTQRHLALAGDGVA
jgi:EAL domain-containing protein (putative c-di-GMP-specific phosphodiesterase class I)